MRKCEPLLYRIIILDPLTRCVALKYRRVGVYTLMGCGRYVEGGNDARVLHAVYLYI